MEKPRLRDLSFRVTQREMELLGPRIYLDFRAFLRFKWGLILEREHLFNR